MSCASRGCLSPSLDDAKLAVVLNLVLERFNADTLPDDFRPYSAVEVAAARKKVLADPLKYRRTLLGPHESQPD